MYTYMFICIYIKQENTVCHIWFVCNTFSGCLNLGVSRNTHMQCFWSCLPWTVACSLRRMLPAHLSRTVWSHLTEYKSSERPLPRHTQCHPHIRSCTCFSSSQLFCWMICFQCNTQWHVPFLLFLQNWMSIPHWKKQLRLNDLWNINFQCFQTVEGGVWVEHNIIQGVRETAGDHPDTPTSS